MDMTTKPAPRKAFLIVDDEAVVRVDIGEIVRECGFEAWEAANTAEALAILESGGATFAGLITDINMPGTRSGVVLANHVRCMWPHINIIVLSAARLPLDGALPMPAKFLAKPVSAKELVSAIHEAALH